MLRRYLVWLFVPLFSLQIHSTEIDSFTDRDPFLEDALFELNELMEGYFAAAIRDANRAGSCDSSVIEEHLLNQVGGALWAPIENDIEASPRIDKRRSARENSIYADTTVGEGFALFMAKLGFLMRVGDFYIGSDKFGHFLSQGHDYFEAMHTKGGTLEDALAYGEMTEELYYGLATTGVYSYGDLSANYDGLHFWERVTNTHLAPSVKPYFTCKNKTWRQNSAFDWNEYANAAWDEGINCSRFKNKSMTDKINARISALEKKRFMRLSCPIEPERCSEMIEHYGNVAPRVVTNACY